MTRRTGTSLVEVLVTVGILGIGLTSVIAMFPMAAITMGQALKDDRTASAAASADGLIRDIHWRHTIEGQMSEPYTYVADGGPTYGLTQLFQDDGPSYPVFIDPMGFYARPGSTFGVAEAVGDGGVTKIPRVNLAMIDSQPLAAQRPLALRMCSQMDGLSYDEDGNVPVANTPDKRELRYNWLWVVQRPVNRDRNTFNLKVVVFDKRVHLYKPPGAEAVANPYVPGVPGTGTLFVPGTTSVTVPLTAEVRKGSWVMDGTVVEAGVTANTPATRHANFYRVLSSTEVNGSYVLELHTPITRLDGQVNQYLGNLVILPGVCDVYERPMLTGAAP